MDGGSRKRNYRVAKHLIEFNLAIWTLCGTCEICAGEYGQYLPRTCSAQTDGSSGPLFAQWNSGYGISVPRTGYKEARLSLRPLLLLGLAGALVVGWAAWRRNAPSQQAGQVSAPMILKEPVVFTTRTFDPAAPPADMPPATPGESAACDSEFLSSASVGSESRVTDATHETLTVTQVKVTLQLNITVWVPNGASQHLLEHEDGHRQISEVYYQTADQVAQRIAATYMGKQVEISGADLNAEANKALQQMAADIADQYKKELNPEPTQLLYDTITDHSRNEVIVKDAVAAAIKNN